MTKGNETNTGIEPLLLAVRGAIERAESLPAPQPLASRARVRALALLWAAHDELAAFDDWSVPATPEAKEAPTPRPGRTASASIWFAEGQVNSSDERPPVPRPSHKGVHHEPGSGIEARAHK